MHNINTKKLYYGGRERSGKFPLFTVILKYIYVPGTR